MKSTSADKVVLVAGGVLIAFNTGFLFVNGLIMLIIPREWYDFVPGVTDTGFFNQHFVRDIGIIQMFLGAAFAVGTFRKAIRVELWVAATLWLAAHACLHFWEVAVGICSPAVIPRDFPAVTLPALIGMVLSVWAVRARTRRSGEWR